MSIACRLSTQVTRSEWAGLLSRVTISRQRESIFKTRSMLRAAASPGIAGLGQVRRFRAAARTSLGDVLLRQGKYKDATKFYAEAKKGAQDDKRLDLMWPAQRGIGRSLWLQAAQEKDPKKGNFVTRVSAHQLSRITCDD